MHYHRPQALQGLRAHIILLAVLGFFCLAALAISFAIPRLSFDVGIQSTGGSAGVVVKRSTHPNDDIRVGDLIESVSGKEIHTKAEFYFQLLGERDATELTIRRFGSRFQRPVSSESFASGNTPLGLRPDDKPIFIAGPDGVYTPLTGVDFEALREIVLEHENDGVLSVIFRRNEEVLSTTVELEHAVGRTLMASLVFILLGLMALVAYRAPQQTTPVSSQPRPLTINILLALAAVSALFIGLGPLLMSVPPIYVIGFASLTLFKAYDLDYHMSLAPIGEKPETWMRIALFTGPIVTLMVPLFLGIREMPLMWGSSIQADDEIRLDVFIIVPMIWTIIYTLIDTGRFFFQNLSCAKAKRLHHFRDYGVLLASFFVLIAVFGLHQDASLTQWMIFIAVLIQAIANAIDFFHSRREVYDFHFDNAIFSPKALTAALDVIQETVGPDYLAQVVADRPRPKHIVALMRSQDPSSLTGLELNALTPAWRDFLELFRIEGAVLPPPDTQSRITLQNPNDPVAGIAERLGIVMALPIAENVAGSLTSLTLIISSHEMPDHNAAPLLPPSQSQRKAIQDVLTPIKASAAAIVYLSAEMSLEYLGEDLDAISYQNHVTESLLLGMRNPTLPLTRAQIPHGLIDELDDLDNPSHAGIVVDDVELGIDQYDTKVYENDLTVLRSQVQILHSQQVRGYALSEIELSASQSETLANIQNLQSPILLIGEAGTGKHLLALSAHQSRSEGPFLTIDAALVPETIFAIDMFGDDDNIGIIRSAEGGGLLIENIDRIPTALLEDVLEAIESLEDEKSIEVYLSIACPETVESSELTSGHYPDVVENIAELCNAEIVPVKALRHQEDILNIVEFFMHKQAMLSNKEILGLSPEAMLAIQNYSWPGNFNELQSVIVRAVIRCESNRIGVADLGRDFIDNNGISTQNIALRDSEIYREQIQLMQVLNETQQSQIEELTERIKVLEEKLETNEPESVILDETLAELELRALKKSIEKYGNDAQTAADALGISKVRYLNKLGKYGLD